MPDFVLPNLGENIDEADVLKVLVAEGDVIARDQSLIEIETEKATLEVPSEVAGRITKIHIAAGDVIKPGQLLLTVDGSSVSPAAAPVPPPTQRPVEQPETPAVPQAAPAPPIALVPPAPMDVRAPDAPVLAPPSVRTLARQIGVDLQAVVGTASNGRVTEDDVRRHASERASETSPVAPAAHRLAAVDPQRVPLPDFAQWGEIEREPLSRLRRTVVRNMAQSWSEIPHAHLYRSVDITAIEELRQQVKARAEAAGGNLTISVMLLKVVASALRANPRLNASVDLAANEVVLKRYVHLGVAVDTERGLVVPKIEDVDRKSIIELSVELNAIAERARNNQLTIEEQRGASFTITNLGSLGTGFFDPIINWPEVAILGLGRAERVPVWIDGQWKPQLRMPMSLGIDHRVIDGADGARFMSWVADAINNPLMMVLGG